MKRCFWGLRRKVDLGLVSLLVFVALTVWLSYTVKTQYAARAKLESSIAQNRFDNFLLHNRVNLLNDAFMDNIQLKGEQLKGSAMHVIAQNLTDADLVPVLYLGAYSCDDCYTTIITGILERLSGNAGFHIISHSSNLYYIEEMHRLNIIKDLSIVLWDDNELYGNSVINSSAELILIDRQQRVNALLPLSFFLDPYLFSTYMAWFTSGL